MYLLQICQSLILDNKKVTIVKIFFTNKHLSHFLNIKRLFSPSPSFHSIKIGQDKLKLKIQIFFMILPTKSYFIRCQYILLDITKIILC